MNDYLTIRDSKTLAQQLRVIFPDSEEALADTVDGETDLTNALYRVLMSAEENRTFCAAISTRISELEERRTRIEQAMEKKRGIVRDAMEQCGIKKFERPELTAFVSASQPAVIITDEAALPAHVMIQPPAKPDKRAIAGLLKAGAEIAGAVLSNPSLHLTIRRA